MTEWQPINIYTPHDGKFRLYGITVHNSRVGNSWFDVHYLALVDGQLVHPSGDIFDAWHYDDLEWWAEAPAWPNNANTPYLSEGDGIA